MSSYDFLLTGPFKPYVRMTQRSMHANPQAQEYLASKVRLGFQLKERLAEKGWPMLPGQTPLAAVVRIVSANGFHHKDLDNQVKALLDAASGIVYPDDRWINAIAAGREAGDTDATYLILCPLADLDGEIR